MKLTEQNFIDAAQELKCEVAAIKAIAAVESRGNGMLSIGAPEILFEAHQFSRLTNHKYDQTHPDISSKLWNRKLYIGGQGEHRRLQAACKLDREAALQAASWGMFQVIGFNWKACGFSSLQEFINAMYSGAVGQLKAFIGFIKSNKEMLAALQKKDWPTLAKLYNGPSYKENKYDTKLEDAYKQAKV